MRSRYKRVLAALLERVADRGDQPDAVFLADEVAIWPTDAVNSLSKAGLLKELPLAAFVTCQGCEEQCRRSVNFNLDDNGRASSISWTCHLPTGLGPFEEGLEPLRRWTSSRPMVARFVGHQLDLELRDHDRHWWRVRYETLRLNAQSRAISVEFETNTQFKMGSLSIPLLQLLDWSGDKIEIDQELLVESMTHSEDTLSGGKRVQTSSTVREARKYANRLRDRHLQQRMDDMAGQYPNLSKEQLAKKLVRLGKNEGVSATRVVRLTRVSNKLGRKFIA